MSLLWPFIIVKRPHTGYCAINDELRQASFGKPIARLTPIVATADSRSGVRFGGIKPTKLRLAADFHAPLTDDDLLNP
jgi:hypothetical protein